MEISRCGFSPRVPSGDRLVSGQPDSVLVGVGRRLYGAPAVPPPAGGGSVAPVVLSLRFVAASSKVYSGNIVVVTGLILVFWWSFKLACFAVFLDNVVVIVVFSGLFGFFSGSFRGLFGSFRGLLLVFSDNVFVIVRWVWYWSIRVSPLHDPGDAREGCTFYTRRYGRQGQVSQRRPRPPQEPGGCGFGAGRRRQHGGGR